MTALTGSVGAPLAAGQLLAVGYEAVEHLHRSAVLDVYDAWSMELEVRCVVKVLRPDRLADERSRERLLSEGRLLERLRHPGIVRGYETIDRPHPAVAMETLGGQTLAHLIDSRRRRLRSPDLAYLGLHLASAVRHLHLAGVLHLDIKPSNVVASAGRAKLIDLSVARPAGEVSPGVGTWCYMAPEQARGGLVDAAADVWGIGATLWEAAQGRALFADDEDGLDYPQLERAAPPCERRRLDPRVGDLIDACLRADATERPSLAAVSSALGPVAGARG